jgi:hypothetical protein
LRYFGEIGRKRWWLNGRGRGLDFNVVLFGHGVSSLDKRPTNPNAVCSGDRIDELRRIINDTQERDAEDERRLYQGNRHRPIDGGGEVGNDLA